MGTQAYRFGATMTAALAIATTTAAIAPPTGAPALRSPGVGLVASLNLLPQPSGDFDVHPRPDAGGLNLGDIVAGLLGDRAPDTDLGEWVGLSGPAGAAPIPELDPAELAAVLGGGFDPAVLHDALLALPDLGAFGLPPIGVGGALGGVDAQSAAAAAAAGVSAIAVALPVLQQGITSGLAAVEMEVNRIVVDAQLAVAREVFGGDNALAALWVGEHNAGLAGAESLFNTALGLGIDPATLHDSLLTSLAGAADPAQFDGLVLTGAPDSLAAMLLDVTGWMNSLFALF